MIYKKKIKIAHSNFESMASIAEYFTSANNQSLKSYGSCSQKHPFCTESPPHVGHFSKHVTDRCYRWFINIFVSFISVWRLRIPFSRFLFIVFYSFFVCFYLFVYFLSAFFSFFVLWVLFLLFVFDYYSCFYIHSFLCICLFLVSFFFKCFSLFSCFLCFFSSFFGCFCEYFSSFF